jgi:hypothetical protein
MELGTGPKLGSKTREGERLENTCQLHCIAKKLTARTVEKGKGRSENAEGVVKTLSRTWGDSGEGVESAIG